MAERLSARDLRLTQRGGEASSNFSLKAPRAQRQCKLRLRPTLR